MKLGGKTAFCLAAFGCAIAARAVVNDGGNPYHPIVERNIFGLKDPPPPPPPEEPKGPPPPKITLTGITDVLGRKLALLEWQEPPGPGQPLKKNFATLTEGQREGKIEVLEIDVKAGIVKVNNHGVADTLSFKDDGAKLPATPFTAPPVGGIPSPTASIPAPAVPQPYTFANTTTTIGTSASATPGVKTIPSRQLRLPAAAQSQTAATTTTQQSQSAQLSAEEQVILMHVEQAVRADEISKGTYPPLPPLPEPK